MRGGLDNLCSNCTKDSAYRKMHCCIASKKKHFQKGEFILYHGSKVEQLISFPKNKINVELILGSGTSIPYSALPISKYIGEVSTFGIIAMFSPTNIIPFDIIAADNCTVTLIKKEDVEYLMMNCKHFLRNYLGFITTQLDSMLQSLTILTLKSLKARLALYLLIISDGSDYTLRCSITNLSKLLGAERSSLSRTISQFVKEEIITFKNGKGVILDINKLKNMIY